MRGCSRRGSRAPAPTPPHPPESHLNPARPAAAPGLPKAEPKQPSGGGRAKRHCHCSCRSRPRPIAMDTQRRRSSSGPSHHPGPRPLDAGACAAVLCGEGPRTTPPVSRLPRGRRGRLAAARTQLGLCAPTRAEAASPSPPAGSGVVWATSCPTV